MFNPAPNEAVSSGRFFFGAGMEPNPIQKDWPAFGYDLADTRYSTPKQIDTENVTKLVRAWTYHMKCQRAACASDSSDWVVRCG
jgi:glucose dehydrogenase